MKKALLPIAAFFVLVSIVPVLAETKTFIREYTYQASEIDSKASSRVIAFQQLKRLLLEEVGTYVESITDVKNNQLTRDQIRTLTAGIVSANIVDERWDGKSYWLKASMKTDPSHVGEFIDKLRNDYQKVISLEEYLKRSDEALTRTEEYKRGIKSGKDDKILSEYNKAINELVALEWFKKGNISTNNKDAIEAYTEAIRINPQLSYPYYNRARLYAKIGNVERAQEDSKIVVRFRPVTAMDYFIRGISYQDLNDHEHAIMDLSEAIKMGLERAGLVYAYRGRGSSYHHLNKHKMAIDDLSKAIDMNLYDAPTYVYRGLSYVELGEKRKAIADFDKAIEIDQKLGPAYYYRGILYLYDVRAYGEAIKDFDRAIVYGLGEDTNTYVMRGTCYFELGQYAPAMNDFNAGINLDKSNSLAYSGRGAIYLKLGNFRQAIVDYDRAIELNPKNGRAYLGRGISYHYLGDNKQAMYNINYAAKLGDEQALDFLRKKAQ